MFDHDDKEVTLSGQFIKIFLLTALAALITLGLHYFQQYLDKNELAAIVINEENYTSVIPKILLKETNTRQYYNDDFHQPFVDLEYNEGIASIVTSDSNWDAQTIELEIETSVAVYTCPCTFTLVQGKLANISPAELYVKNTKNIDEPIEVLSDNIAPSNDNTTATAAKDEPVQEAIAAENATSEASIETPENNASSEDASVLPDSDAEALANTTLSEQPDESSSAPSIDPGLARQLEHLPFMDKLH